MPVGIAKRPETKRRLIIALCVVAGLLFLYSVAGFWVLPGILQSMLPGLIADRLPVKATVGQIKLNPFLLTATVHDLTVQEEDGEHLAGLKALYADLQLGSIFRWSVYIKEVRLTQPDALIRILPDGRLNVQVLLDAIVDSTAADTDKSAQPPILEVKRFILTGGKAVLRDQSSTSPFEATLAPIRVALKDFTTRTDTESRFEFRAGTDRGEQFRGEGRLTIQPFSARGAVSAAGIGLRRLWQAVQDAVNFEITDGHLDIAGSFSAGIGAEGLRLQLADGRADLKRFSLAEKGASVPLISVPSLSVVGAGFDLDERRVRVASVQIDDARIRSYFAPDGTVQLLNVMLPESPTPREAPDTKAPETQPAFNIDDWNLQVDRIGVQNAGIELQDRSLSPAVPLRFGPINLSVQGLKNRVGEAATITLNMQDDFGGRFDISGQIGANPLVADLKVRVTKAAAKKLEPYVKAIAAVDVVSGTADVDGQIKFIADGTPKMQYRGGLRVDDMEVFIAGYQRNLMKFSSLSVNGVQMDLAPNRLQISDIVIDGLRGNLVVEPDGNLNVNRVVARADKEASDLAESLPGRLIRTIKENIRGPFPINVDALRVKQAAAHFEDRSLKPAVAMALEEINGEMTDISTLKRTPVKVSIDGKIDASAPLQISGSLVPFGEKTDMDMRVSLNNFKLRSISPYSGKHVGYTIDKGRMSLALEYSLSADIIDGKNEILLQQLTLGQRTDSPNAIDLPLGLAVALLKDLNGNIRLDVPVRGDIDDPEFSVGNVFVGTLIKFVTGIVSSPFKVMVGLAGAVSTEELDRVVFNPGSSALTGDQVEKLAAVAKALRERPSLKVAIAGRAYARLDAAAMAAVDSEKQTTDQTGVDEEQLLVLARQRAQSIRDALVLQGNVESQRVKILPEKLMNDSDDGQVVCTLQLTAG